MPIEFKKTVAIFDGVCTIEEAETLLGWFIEQPKGKVNLKKMTHMHTAILQVLMASKAPVSSWPDDADVKNVIGRLLGNP